MFEEFLKYTATGVIGLLLVYLAARIISAAYFKSKQQYENNERHYHG